MCKQTEYLDGYRVKRAENEDQCHQPPRLFSNNGHNRLGKKFPNIMDWGGNLIKTIFSRED